MDTPRFVRLAIALLMVAGSVALAAGIWRGQASEDGLPGELRAGERAAIQLIRRGDAPASLPDPIPLDPRIGQWVITLPDALSRRQRREWKTEDLELAVHIGPDGMPVGPLVIAGPIGCPALGESITGVVQPTADGWQLTSSLPLADGARNWAMVGEFSCEVAWRTDRWHGTYRAEWTDPRQRVEFTPSANLEARRQPSLIAPLVTSVRLQGPLGTTVAVSGQLPEQIDQIEAELVIPTTAPDDLAVAAYVRQADGTWYQGPSVSLAAKGQFSLVLPVDAGESSSVMGLYPGQPWSAFAQLRTQHAGLVFTTAAASAVVVGIPSLTAQGAGEEVGQSRPVDGRITDVVFGSAASPGLRAETGQRWELSFRPSPWPAQPDHVDDFQADLDVIDADGRTVATLPAFHHQPMDLVDIGNREVARPAGQARFVVRYRPSDAGVYRLRLRARWGPGAHEASTETSGEASAEPQVFELGELAVDGEAWREMVQVDAHDRRFLSTQAGELVWPVGVNLHSAFDTRARDRIGTRLTPFRPWAVYRDILTRFAAHGVDTVEIWLAPWNLALEWTGTWPGYHDLDGYNHGNIERVDRIMDLCEELGIRVILVLRNHVTATRGKIWEYHPLHVRMGGSLRHPTERFTDAEALAADARHRRYLVARWADSPALMAWKLWSEQNLTRADRTARVEWHRTASDDLTSLDTYDHPITTHWSGNLKGVELPIAELPNIDLVVLNAYRGERDNLGDRLWQTIHEFRRGLGRVGKPILITEYGGNWTAAGANFLSADLQTAPWIALASGHAGAPMFWWWEWIDQSGAFHSYRAIRTFLKGEDLRGADAQARMLAIDDPNLAVRAWARPGRILGHVVDHAWALAGNEPAPVHRNQIVEVGADVAAGEIVVEYWDCGAGTVIERRTYSHPGGAWQLVLPDFARQLAFKAWRLE